MRQSYSNQLRMDCVSIENVPLNLDCRHEIIPLLAGLQHVYSDVELRQLVTNLIGNDVNSESRTDIGRTGYSYWQIAVLGIVRLGCNLNYDQLQDLCENHRALRGILGVGEWDSTRFGFKRIRDSLSLIKPSTLEAISQLIVQLGQNLHGAARDSVRADSFVIETNIHYPTESSLIWDGLRKLLPVSQELASSLKLKGWRQWRHQLKQIKQDVREIARLSASEDPKVIARVYPAYGKLLKRVGSLLDRIRNLQKVAEKSPLDATQDLQSKQVKHWYSLTSRVVDTAFRRTQLGEKVPNADKLFSIFESHTQLYRRGKAGQPNQFGRMVMVYEDAAGFISHYYLMGRNELDSQVVVEQTQIAQRKHEGQIADASFDRGYYSPDNQTRLESIVTHPCLPPRHRNQYAQWLKQASDRLQESRKRHSGIESAIGALQSGNGLSRCRDRGEEGLARYLGFAVLARNLHVLGKLLIARRNGTSAAAISKRAA